ncbi:MAG: DNA/RNA non-specific endonuclease [Rhodobacteraceae bacterium]|nr:DNA/RNA non-specific endonuclease [Paracoccaceae bacterium]
MSVEYIIRATICSLLALPFFNLIGSANAQEIHFAHCVKGCPSGAPVTNDLIVREIYVLSSNDDRKFADWVAYRVTNDTIGSSSSLLRTWKSDPSLDGSETLELNDYSGANQAHDYDKGHQAPLAAFAGTVYWRETNFLSNITPQKANLNQGAWKELESAVRHATDHLRELYVITGPLYDGNVMPELPGANEQHQVPTGYWKVISTAGGRITAFIFEQATPRNADYCDHRRSVSEVEARSGLDLFPEVSNWPSGDLSNDLDC